MRIIPPQPLPLVKSTRQSGPGSCRPPTCMVTDICCMTRRDARHGRAGGHHRAAEQQGGAGCEAAVPVPHLGRRHRHAAQRRARHLGQLQLCAGRHAGHDRGRADLWVRLDRLLRPQTDSNSTPGCVAVSLLKKVFAVGRVNSFAGRAWIWQLHVDKTLLVANSLHVSRSRCYEGRPHAHSQDARPSELVSDCIRADMMGNCCDKGVVV